MPRLLQVSHGYPPLEVGGTEIYARRLSVELRQRGWQVEVLAATRDPGRVHGSQYTEEVDGIPVHRVVNNLPWRPLGRAEQDPLVERAVQGVEDDFHPDLVHIQHLLFLSSRLSFRCPTVHTLHDAWAWCARGGTLLREGVEICPGPEASACISCYGEWARGSAWEHGLARAAGVVGRFVSPETLKKTWDRVPSAVKGTLQTGRPLEATPNDWRARQDAVTEAHARADVRVAPSAWLAREAEAHGLGPTLHLPHGVDLRGAHTGGGPLLFLGSLVPHKGAHLVVEAWERARREDPSLPELEVAGPAVDPVYAASLPAALLRGPLSPEEVSSALSTARALVLGSTWPENSPLVILEARASGCPIIAPRLGGIPEIIDEGRDGILYPPGDVEALCQALHQICGQAYDEVRPPPTFHDHIDWLERLYRELSPLL